MLFRSKHRCDDDRLLLLLSNLTGAAQNVTVEHFVAQFTAPDTPETWVNVLTTVVAVPNDTVANLLLTIGKNYPYHQLFINAPGNVRPALYLLESLTDAVQDFPLIPAGDWETIV